MIVVSHLVRALALLLVASCCISSAAATQSDPGTDKRVHIYVNDATGFAQQEFPGHMEPYMTADNKVRLWYNQAREAVDVSDGKGRYIWIPDYSFQYQRWYYYNQQTDASQWEMPHDMGWRRVTLDMDEL